jgi:hypothetical protein
MKRWGFRRLCNVVFFMGLLRGITRVGSRGGALVLKILCCGPKNLCEWDVLVSSSCMVQITLSSPRWSGSEGAHGIGQGISQRGQGEIG